MIPPQEVECAIAVARNGSFRKAASELYLSQPAVSMYINRLERRLGATIFERTRTGTQLTHAGHEVLPHLTALLAMHHQVEAACQRIGRAEQSTLSIASHRLGLLQFLPPAFKVMRGIIDGLLIEAMQSVSSDMIELVLSGAADIGLSWRAAGDDSGDERVEEVAIATCLSVLFVNAGHRLAGKQVITATDLAGETIITLHSPLARLHTESYLEGVDGLTWNTTDDVQVAMQMVSERVGVTILVDIAGKVGPESNVSIAIDDPMTFEMTMVRDRSNQLNPPAQILWDLLLAEYETAAAA